MEIMINTLVDGSHRMPSSIRSELSNRLFKPNTLKHKIIILIKKKKKSQKNRRIKNTRLMQQRMMK